jgi:hypothetical protein
MALLLNCDTIQPPIVNHVYFLLCQFDNAFRKCGYATGVAPVTHSLHIYVKRANKVLEREEAYNRNGGREGRARKEERAFLFAPGE